MIPAEEFLTTLGRQLGNHLWQSTAVAAIAALMALTLKSNHARARYWLWMAASLKFLVPFSMLAAIGGRLGAWLTPAAPIARVSLVVQQVVQPFTPVEQAFPAVAMGNARAVASALPGLLLVVWLCGLLAVMIHWWSEWRRVAAAVRASRRLAAGREVEALRRLGGPCFDVVASPANLEPGVFGVFRQVLWVPEGLGNRLSDAELEAILAHELCHARRRDNLAAAIHWAVEAIFWFHPLVWWLGGRLTEERERACDEEVLRLNGDPRAYAEGILKVCELYLAPPVCAAAVTGGELKKRIEGIMANRFTRELGYGRKALLAAAAALVVAAPVVIGLMNPPGGRAAARVEMNPPAGQASAQVDMNPLGAQTALQAVTKAPEFEAASVRPAPPWDNSGIRIVGRLYGGPGSPDPGFLRCTNCSLSDVVMKAYGLESYQLSGPAPLGNEFVISARVPAGATNEQVRLMLQNLLAERFKMKVHWEKKDLQGYALVVGKGGPNLKASAETEPAPAQQSPPRLTLNRDFFVVLPPGYPAEGIMTYGNGPLCSTGATRASMTQLAQELTRKLSQPVLNETGLKGKYDFTLYWAREPIDPSTDPERRPPPEDLPLPTLSEALQKLGLNVQSKKVPTDVLVVDHVERVPTEN